MLLMTGATVPVGVVHFGSVFSWKPSSLMESRMNVEQRKLTMFSVTGTIISMVYNICHNLLVTHVGLKRTKATLIEVEYHKSP